MKNVVEYCIFKIFIEVCEEKSYERVTTMRVRVSMRGSRVTDPGDTRRWGGSVVVSVPRGSCVSPDGACCGQPLLARSDSRDAILQRSAAFFKCAGPIPRYSGQFLVLRLKGPDFC